MLLHHEGFLSLSEWITNLAMLGITGVALAVRIGWHTCADFVKACWYTLTRRSAEDVDDGR